MKFKFSILAICIIWLMTSCSANSVGTEGITANKFTPEITSTEIPSVITSEPKNNSLGGDPDRQVDGFIVNSLDEIDNLSKASNDNLNKLEKYGYEKCYFKLVNPPKDMDIDLISFLEVGFFTFYSNPVTEDSVKFHWWADQEPEDYINELEENITRIGTTLIKKNDNTYYCDFVTITKEPTDKTSSEQPYIAEIRWVEDNKCFYVSVLSATPLDESVLDYCIIEKHSIS